MPAQQACERVLCRRVGFKSTLRDVRISVVLVSLKRASERTHPVRRAGQSDSRCVRPRWCIGRSFVVSSPNSYLPSCRRAISVIQMGANGEVQFGGVG